MLTVGTLRSAAIPIGLVALLPSLLARAGPPLVTDDPHTAVHRRIELHSAVVATDRGSNTELGWIVFDLAYGLTPRLELGAGFGLNHSNHAADDDGGFEYAGVPLGLGFKWQLFASDHVHAAIAPSLTVDLDDGDDVAAFLPALVELRANHFRLGGEAAYVPRDDAHDGWFSGLFTGVRVGERSELLAEVWASAFHEHDDPELNWALGFDWVLSDRLHLLAAGGTGFFGGHTSRRDWSGTLGLQLNLGPLGTTSPADPTHPARSASLAGASLLNLTDRQLAR